LERIEPFELAKRIERIRRASATLEIDMLVKKNPELAQQIDKTGWLAVIPQVEHMEQANTHCDKIWGKIGKFRPRFHSFWGVVLLGDRINKLVAKIRQIDKRIAQIPSFDRDGEVRPRAFIAAWEELESVQLPKLAAIREDYVRRKARSVEKSASSQREEE
jgi:hypothetical protein